VFIPKYRRKALYVELRRYLGEVFRKLAERKESRIEEGQLLSDPVHLLIPMSRGILVVNVSAGFNEEIFATDYTDYTESEEDPYL
jgi:hypothetical protein